MASDSPPPEDNEQHDDLPWSAYVFAVWNLIIRPPRCRYSRDPVKQGFPLGDFKFRSNITDIMTAVIRTDFELQNPQGAKLVCTLFEPEQVEMLRCGSKGSRLVGNLRERACVVYCHGNGSSRLGGFDLVPLLLPLNIGLVCFDFSGSGMSGGDYVSLGYHEKDDLACVVDHLRSTRRFSRIGFWGHSMGAATALMQASRDPSIAAVIADSPFSDLTQLIKEICNDAVRLPAALVTALLAPIRLAIRSKAKFDVRDVSPRAVIGNCFVPTLFLHGTQDFFVNAEHSEVLCKEHGGESKLVMMPNTDHASRRKAEFNGKALLFMVRAMRWESFMPSIVTDQTLQHIASGSSKADISHELRMGENSQKVLDRDVSMLFSNSRPDATSLGLLKAACELSGAYRGATLMPFYTAANQGKFNEEQLKSYRQDCWCLVKQRAREDAYTGFPRLPVEFVGRIRFDGADERAEVALCWTRCGSQQPKEASVGFAVISPSAISITYVTLRKEPWRVKEAADIPLSKASASSYVCESVEPQALSAAEVAVGVNHSVFLRLREDGAVELVVGSLRVHVAGDPKRSSQETPGDGVHLWCLQWRSDKSQLDNAACCELRAQDIIASRPHHTPQPQFNVRPSARLDLDIRKTMSLGPRPPTLPTISRAASMAPGDRSLRPGEFKSDSGMLQRSEVRLAEDLATFCLGPPTLPNAFDDEDDDDETHPETSSSSHTVSSQLGHMVSPSEQQFHTASSHVVPYMSSLAVEAGDIMD